MKKIFTLLFVFTFASMGAIAQDEGTPNIVFEKTSHDFGVINEGKQATHEFVFTNTGDAPLVLKNVRPSCGCTVPEWPKKPIMPGEKATIKATYNSKGRPGKFHKSITVTTNIPDNGTKVLYIKGEVQKQAKSPVRAN